MNFNNDLEVIHQALNKFYQKSLASQDPVIQQRPMKELIEEMALSNLVRDGGLTGEALKKFIQMYLSDITKIYHPANIAHQQAVPHYMAALAGLVDHFVSSDGSIYEFGPASVSIEYFLINWLLGKVGWPLAPLDPGNVSSEGFGGGILTHGGSLANLTALIAARTRIAPEVWERGNPEDLVVLASAGSHYSIARAVGIMGLGNKAVYPLDVDEKGRIIPDQLPCALEKAIGDGKRVFALVATAGSTPVGLFDPLQAIGEFCREQDIWFHVDGAHGGAVLLSQKNRQLMQGIELADSLVINAHKMMRVTAFCSALLVREAQHLDHAFHQEATYLFHPKDQPGYDFLHRTVECTKPVLGLKLFMVLAAMGERGMGEYIDRQIELTKEAYEYMQSLDDFRCPVQPQCNILCFQVEGIGDGHLALRDKLLARGRYYVSTTSFNDEWYLRLTLTNPATDMAVIKGFVQEIRDLVR